MSKKIIAFILSALLVSGVLAACQKAPTPAQTTGTTASGTEQKTEEVIITEDPNANTVSVSSKSYSLTNTEVEYFVMTTYLNFISNISANGYSPAMFGIDTKKPLTQQKCETMEQFETWHDFFLAEAITQLKTVLPICEKAKEEGFELEEEIVNKVKTSLDELAESAEKEGSSLDKELQSAYGKYITREIVEELTCLTSYASAYLEMKLANVDVSDAVLEAEYEKNKEKYETINYVAYSFDYKDIIEDGADDSAVEAAKAQMQKYADELAKCTDKESFIDCCYKNMIEVLKLTEKDAKDVCGKLASEKVAYNEKDEFVKWAFGANVGDVKVETNDKGVINVYLLTARNGRDDSISLRDVRHILFLKKTHGTSDKAEEVYNKWVADGAKLEDFEALALEYSEDPGSASVGGLYENVAAGDMVDEFNDWLFDSKRVEGDHGIVETESFGWHIMYYVGGSSKWKADMKSAITDAAYDAIVEEATKAYSITVDEELLKTLVG